MDILKVDEEVDQRMKEPCYSASISSLPLFVDNFLGFKDQIVSTKSIMAPLEGDKKFTLVAVRDVGLVAAKILTDFEKHFGKTYTLTTPSTSYNEICRAFSEVGNFRGWGVECYKEQWHA